jgi:hypothetical protein
VLLAESRTRQGAYLARALSTLEASDLRTLDQALGVLERLLEAGR